MSHTIAPPQEPNRADWLMWAAVAFVGGSAPAAINVAIEGAPPAIIAGVRLWLATLVLVVFTLGTGRPLLGIRTKADWIAWGYAAAAGATGYAIPFTLFPLAQQEVSSIMAGIFMSFLPVITVLVAAAFAGEPLTRRSLAGVAVGTVGVLILIGPAALTGAEGTLYGQGLLMLAILGYAATGIVMRRAPEVPVRSFTTAMMLCSAIITTPPLFFADWSAVNGQGLWALAYLGLGPTGLTAICVVTVVRRAGASFLSTSAYVAPVVSVILGIIIFSEAFTLNQAVGLLTIFLGISLTRGVFARLQKEILPRIIVTAFPNKRTRSPDE
ncbi:MAG: DMT family transporter [Pseudomonadota bacterium]